MWSSYSARAAAELIGLPESAVRSCVREGLVGERDASGALIDVPARLAFRDLAVLRVVKSLIDAGVAMARVRRELVRIARALPDGVSLAELPIEARGGRVHVRGGVPGASQLELPLDPPSAAPAGEVRELGRRRDTLPPLPIAPVTAEAWFARALALEDRDTPMAVDAYRAALRLRPEWAEAWVNLGRLYAENTNPVAATECFRAALELDPQDATAIYNLGVVAQDSGREADAIALYARALELDATIAEAHYNLATLFDQGGDSRAAIRHINEYRKLTKTTP